MRRIAEYMETADLRIQEASLIEVDALQNICESWRDKERLEGDVFDKDHAQKAVTTGHLPPVEDASKRRFHFKAIYEKASSTPIGLLELYEGYPKEETLWIGLLIIETSHQGKGYARQAIQALTEVSAASQFNKLGVGVALKNWKGLRFWTQAGFTHIRGIYGDKTYSPETFSLAALEKIL